MVINIYMVRIKYAVNAVRFGYIFIQDYDGWFYELCCLSDCDDMAGL